MVTRTFVLLMPLFFFATAFVISRATPLGRTAGWGALYLLFCNVSTVAFVGRSDATAVCGLVVCGALAHRLLDSRHRNWSNRRYIATQIALGAVSAAVLLTNWRYAPIVASLQFVVLTTQLGGSILHPPGRSLFGRALVRLGTALKHVTIRPPSISSGSRPYGWPCSCSSYTATFDPITGTSSVSFWAPADGAHLPAPRLTSCRAS